MNDTPSSALSLIMILAGIGIPIMAALNSGLGTKLGNPVQAATMLFSLALVSSLLVLMIQPKAISTNFHGIPLHFFLGGFFVAFYVLSITFIAPKIGVGNAIVLVLLGQMVASAAIDHFGWLGAQQVTLTVGRFVGLVFIFVGVVLARRTIDGT